MPVNGVINAQCGKIGGGERISRIVKLAYIVLGFHLFTNKAIQARKSLGGL
jgi:hypothetical protein